MPGNRAVSRENLYSEPETLNHMYDWSHKWFYGRFHADSEGIVQKERMQKLIWDFAGRIGCTTDFEFPSTRLNTAYSSESRWWEKPSSSCHCRSNFCGFEKGDERHYLSSRKVVILLFVSPATAGLRLNYLRLIIRIFFYENAFYFNKISVLKMDRF